MHVDRPQTKHICMHTCPEGVQRVQGAVHEPEELKHVAIDVPDGYVGV